VPVFEGGTVRIAIIGGDAAGMSAASQAKRLGPEHKVMVFERGQHISYAPAAYPTTWEER
jgi:NADPH-dependent 2,4-dienoyl-CoA reductase/sulfur reductase-like enzyme